MLEREVKSESRSGSREASNLQHNAASTSTERTVASVRRQKWTVARTLEHVVDWFLPNSTATGQRQQSYNASQIRNKLRQIVKQDHKFVQLHALPEDVQCDLSTEKVEARCREIEEAVTDVVLHNEDFFYCARGRETLRRRLRSDDKGGYRRRFEHPAWREVLSEVEYLLLHGYPVPWLDRSGRVTVIGQADEGQSSAPDDTFAIEGNSSRDAVDEFMDDAPPISTIEPGPRDGNRRPRATHERMETPQLGVTSPQATAMPLVPEIVPTQSTSYGCQTPTIKQERVETSQQTIASQVIARPPAPETRQQQTIPSPIIPRPLVPGAPPQQTKRPVQVTARPLAPGVPPQQTMPSPVIPKPPAPGTVSIQTASNGYQAPVPQNGPIPGQQSDRVPTGLNAELFHIFEQGILFGRRLLQTPLLPAAHGAMSAPSLDTTESQPSSRPQLDNHRLNPTLPATRPEIFGHTFHGQGSSQPQQQQQPRPQQQQQQQPHGQQQRMPPLADPKR